MFLEIEGSRLVNISRVSHVELLHGEDEHTALLYDGGYMIAKSHLAYAYFMNEDNSKSLLTS